MLLAVSLNASSIHGTHHDVSCQLKAVSSHPAVAVYSWTENALLLVALLGCISWQWLSLAGAFLTVKHRVLDSSEAKR